MLSITISTQIKEKLDNLPESPGIYKMLDKNNSIIYIGKSKCLKKRVKSYFVESPKWEKAIRMAPLIKDIEIVTTDTHLEAMLLECKLIKEIQPYFNVQMKNDNRYVFVKISTDNRSAPLTVVHERGKHCYGPFKSKHLLQKIIDDLKNIYPIEKMKRTYQFDYHILPVSMTNEEKEKNNQAISELFINIKKMERFTKQLEKKMSDEAKAFRFEMASRYRDILQSVQYLRSGVDRYQELLEKKIILKYSISNGYKLIFIAKGQVIEKQCVQEVTNIVQEKFIKNAIEKSRNIDVNANDKNNIDYRDILYSEIMSLPDDSVLVLDDETVITTKMV